MNQAYRGRGQKGPGRLVIRADEPTLTPYAGLAVTGELARRLGLAGLIDAQLAIEHRARPVKQRRRGLTAGELLVALAESSLPAATASTTLRMCAPTLLGPGYARSRRRRLNRPLSRRREQRGYRG